MNTQIPPPKYKYKIGVLIRAIEYPEIVYADNLPQAISEVTRRVLKYEPNIKTWKTRLISELDMTTMKYLRRGNGKFE